jgi:hypothetical protein
MVNEPLLKPERYVALDFFDLHVDLGISRVDYSDAFWFFNRHIRSHRDQGKLLVRCSKNFFRDLLAKSDRIKAMSLEEDGNMTHIAFSSWSGAPSFLPPFASARFLRRYAVIHGSVVSSASGFTVMILGSNYSGKTSICLELMRRGWQPISDSCVVLDFGDPMGVCLRRYETPIGLRRDTLARWRDRLAAVDTRTQISQATGTVVLAHARDLFPELEAPDKVQIHVTVVLADSTLAASGGRRALRVYPGSRKEEVLAYINARPIYFMSPSSRTADAIVRLVDSLKVGRQT